MKSLLLLIGCLFSLYCGAQLSLEIKTVNEKGDPVPLVTVSWNGRSAQTNESGVCRIADIPAGKYRFSFSHASFEEVRTEIEVPLITSWTVIMREEEEEEEEVIVTATRTSRTIANSPTRVEVISGEELEEKGNMKPGDIRMLLNESTGIQVQQTSATSYNSSIRIQGLDGRYTQLLKDGFPMYGGFSGGLSLLQIVPLDLKQVEVIKGSASTLYGGGAIAGLVNLVSKTPAEERQVNLMANGTSAGGLDLSGFYSEQFGKMGTTVFLSRNTSNAYDPGNTGFSAIPEFQRYLVNPKLFYRSGNFGFDIGLSYSTEDRLGGSMSYIKEADNTFFEENKSKRYGVQSRFQHTLSPASYLRLKAAFNFFERTINAPAHRFDGDQAALYSELTLNTKTRTTEWVLGLDGATDNFKQFFPYKFDVNQTTLGLFAQNTWNATEKLTLESGIRIDRLHLNDEYEFLPRISLLYRFRPNLVSRLGGGLGYKVPSIFTEESERLLFKNVWPINPKRTKNEESAGFNADINWTTSTGEIEWSINQLFFYTRIADPLLLVAAPGGNFEFINANGSIETKGIETNVKGVLGDFKLFVGYTYANVRAHIDGWSRRYPLTPKHRVNNVLMYEIEEKLKLGLEAYYIGEQQLTDGTGGRSYWITGFMAEKIWEKFSVFINFENFSNTRQSKWEPIYTGTLQEPVFKDIYAPLEGFVVNGGFKLRL